jgi:hypothetical protein
LTSGAYGLVQLFDVEKNLLVGGFFIYLNARQPVERSRLVNAAQILEFSDQTSSFPLRNEIGSQYRIRQ